MNKTIDVKAMDYIDVELLAMISEAVDTMYRCEVAVAYLQGLPQIRKRF